MRRNIKLDATLVHAAIMGLIVPCAIGLGMTSDEVDARATWLKKQPMSYVKQVSDEVVRLEKEEEDARRL